MASIAASKPSLARGSRRPSPPILLLIFLHLLFVLQIVVGNYKFLTLWFSHPSLRIRMFPIHSGTNEVTLIAYAVCLLGLAFAKPWGWWLALVLDSLAILGYLLVWRYLFLRPFVAGDMKFLFFLLAAPLNPIALALLFFPGVAGHFSVDRLLAKYPWLESLLERIPFSSVDKLITRIIALVQLLVSGGMLFATFAYFPWLFFYPLLGVVSAGFLFTARRGARIACIWWQSVSVGAFVIWWIQHPNLNIFQNSSNREEAYAAAYLLLAALYLLMSLFYFRYEINPTSNRSFEQTAP